MNKLTGCPVPREVSDSEKILKWLGFVPHELEEGCENPELWRRDKEMLYGRKHPDVRLDYLVLEKVRRLDEEVIECFENHLHTIYMNRWVHEEKPETPTTLLLHILFHLPGDYAEAASFLWEGE